MLSICHTELVSASYETMKQVQGDGPVKELNEI